MVRKFAEELRDVIAEKLQDNSVHLDIQNVVKTNNTELTGIAFKGDSPIAPIIYVNDWFDAYNRDELTIDEIADNMLDVYRESQLHRPMQSQVESLLNYEQMKNRLIVCVVGIDNNQEMLKNTPHKVVAENIAMFVRIEADQDHSGVATVVVNNELLSNYEVSFEDLLSQAWKSMEKNHPMKIADLVERLLSMHPEMAEVIPVEARGMQYVVEVNNGLFGSAYGFNSKSLDEISKLVGENFYVLPASINEFIVMPERTLKIRGFEPEFLNEMVTEVNNGLDEKEILSNNAYYYDAEIGKLQMVGVNKDLELFSNIEVIDSDLELPGDDIDI